MSTTGIRTGPASFISLAVMPSGPHEVAAGNSGQIPENRGASEKAFYCDVLKYPITQGRTVKQCQENELVDDEIVDWVEFNIP